MSQFDFPDVGTRWIHCKTGRVCKVVGQRQFQNPITSKLAGTIVRLVEFKYQRQSGGTHTRTRPQPMQTMPLEQWRELFTKPYEAP